MHSPCRRHQACQCHYLMSINFLPLLHALFRYRVPAAPASSRAASCGGWPTWRCCSRRRWWGTRAPLPACWSGRWCGCSSTRQAQLPSHAHRRAMAVSTASVSRLLGPCCEGVPRGALVPAPATEPRAAAADPFSCLHRDEPRCRCRCAGLQAAPGAVHLHQAGERAPHACAACELARPGAAAAEQRNAALPGMGSCRQQLLAAATAPAAAVCFRL